MKKIRNPENIDFKKHPILPGYVVASEEDMSTGGTGGWMFFANGWNLHNINHPLNSHWTYLRPATKPTKVTVTHPEVSALKAALKGFSTGYAAERGKWLEICLRKRPTVRQLTRCDDGCLRDSSGKLTARVAGAYYKRIGR